MSLFLSLVWSLATVLVLAGGASAQNGLQRFERDIKPQLEFDKFTHGSASPLGANSFILNDVVASAKTTALP